MSTDSKTPGLGWYCARTQLKHEHIAAGNLRVRLGAEVFHPRLRIERATRRGVVKVIEPLFPCYIFVRCVLKDAFDEIRYTPGISSIVQFGSQVPIVPDPVIDELRQCFEAEEPMTVQDNLRAGLEVVVVEGAFSGMRGVVIRALSSKQRVQILLDFLGRTTVAELDRKSVTVEERRVAELMPSLALGSRNALAIAG